MPNGGIIVIWYQKKSVSDLVTCPFCCHCSRKTFQRDVPSPRTAIRPSAEVLASLTNALFLTETENRRGYELPLTVGGNDWVEFGLKADMKCRNCGCKPFGKSSSSRIRRNSDVCDATAPQIAAAVQLQRFIKGGKRLRCGKLLRNLQVASKKHFLKLQIPF